MRIYDGKTYRDMTEAEIKAMEEQSRTADLEYWNNIDYDEAVNKEIRKKYSESQEFAILRQKDEKPQEYQEYYNYCEECKNYVKEMIRQYKVVK